MSLPPHETAVLLRNRDLQLGYFEGICDHSLPIMAKLCSLDISRESVFCSQVPQKILYKVLWV